MNHSYARFRWLVLLALLTLGATAHRCLGHGTPIHVEPVAGKLTVSNGLVDDRGYADWVFADPDDQEAVFTPIAGNRLRISLPGFQFYNFANDTAVSLEAISRPDFTKSAAPFRWLWYATPPTGAVADVPSALRLDANSSQGFTPNISLAQSTPPANATLKIADLTLGDLGEHLHLVNYLLNDAGAASGAYGFFARLTSPDYAPSDPFLIALNNGLDAATFQAGAKRINAAARLPGDYDGDADVDGLDLLTWQRTLGSTAALAADGSVNDLVDAADLAVWRDNFGRTAPAVLGAVSSIPEPTTHLLAFACLGAAAGGWRRRLKTGCRE